MIFRIFLLACAVCIALTGCRQHFKYRQTGDPSVQAGPMTGAREAPVMLRRHLEGPPADRDRSAGSGRPGDSGRAYRLDSGDHLRITVFGQVDLSRTYSVDGGGYISMPLIGAVEARGATTFELERRIAAKLGTKYVKDPKVTVEIQTYRPFFILGEVRSPGQFPYVSGMTVETAVAIAGGYTERARKSRVKLTRRNHGGAVSHIVPRSFPVEPGDTIYVKERFF